MALFRIYDDRGLKQYLEEISRFQLLEKEEEFELARRIRTENDEEAKEKMICSNLRIVVYIAKRFQNQGLSLSDLINAGNKGLIHATTKYDERKGYRFNTYSVWWIKRAIYDAINVERGIVPRSYLAKRIQLKTLKFIQQKGREPTVEELAQTMKVDESAVSMALAELIPPYSLDETFEESENPYIESVRLDIEGADNLISPAPDEIFYKKEQKDKLLKALGKLEPREQEILKRNFGLGDFDVHSLEDISRIMNITRERVRQIKENALRKLKIVLSRRQST
ncbi:sigma-70 family RNA polymerase sigma factor [candidate division WOR-3 bacterium]|nr:sigma-70 family RNA polymerase sigma factor [candidate division WOR-3 bacterium]